MHDQSKATHTISFIEKYCCQKNGQPIRLLKWQIDLITKLYGTVKADNTRQYRTVFCLVPRRNGKSVLMACLLMYHLVTGDPGTEIYLLSNTVTQSGDSVFAACRTIATYSPALKKILKVLKTKGRIENITNNSRIVILTSNADSLPGKDAKILLYDEIAFFAKRECYTNLRGSQLNQSEPLNISITTASDKLEGHIGKELYDYSKSIINNEIVDETFLPIIYEASPDDDWTHPSTWRKANPSCPDLIKEEDLGILCKEAQNEPRKKSEFL